MIFREEPTDFEKEIDVVGCYIQCGDKFILLHRNNHKTNGGKFGLPAGKVDGEESTHDAMCREIKEETNIEVKQDELEFIDSVFVRNAGHDIHYHMFIVKKQEEPPIQINPDEHQGYKWVTPSEALEMDLIHDLDECIKMYYRA